jgi:triacylglycerol lipase
MDPRAAVRWGPFIQAAFDQFRGAPDQVNPDSIQGLPTDYKLVRTLQMADFILEPGETPTFFGFLAIGGNPQTQVIVVRGTATATEWWDNLHFGPVPFRRVGGNVAEGFLDLYQTLTSMDPRQPAAAPDQNLGLYLRTDLPLVVTGHSVGGALVTLLAADLMANHRVAPHVWTFGSPKVGDAAFAAIYNANSTVSWRIYNVQDVVPLVPIDPADTYQHVNTGYAINSTGKARWTVGCAHELSTYLYVLSPGTTELDPLCRIVGQAQVGYV